MRVTPGLYNNHGFVQIRIWPWPKTEKPKPYTEGGFGCWCEKHIKEAEKRLRVLRDEIEGGKFAKQQALRDMPWPEGCDTVFRIHWLEKKRSKKSILNAKSNFKLFKALWENYFVGQITPKEIKRDFLDKSKVGPGTLRGRMEMLETIFDQLERYVKLKLIDPIRLPDFNPITPFDKPSGKYKGKKHLSLAELTRYKRWTLEHDPELWVASYYAASYVLRHGDLNSQAGKDEVVGSAEKTGKTYALPGAIPRAAKIPNFQTRWEAARAACDITWFHWHWWRAQGGKIMRWEGVPEKTVQELYQHSSVQQTREYTGDPEWARPAIDKVKEFLDKL